MLSDLQDAETGQRGFLLTVDETYLQPFYRALKSEPAGLPRLRELTSDNPEQQQRLKNLEPLIAAKLEVLQQTVALARQGQHDAAIAVVKSDRGKRLMDGIRTELDTFRQTELNLLTEREAAVVSLRGWLLAFICLSLAIAVALIGLFARSTFNALNVVRERTVALELELKLRRETEHTLRQVQKIEARNNACKAQPNVTSVPAIILKHLGRITSKVMHNRMELDLPIPQSRKAGLA